MRLPLTGRPVVTPHGAFGRVRSSPRHGACGWRGVYPCQHQGVDLASPAGTPVFAPERMEVVLAATDNVTPGLRGFGPGAIKARGESGAVHTLGHLDPRVWGGATPTGVIEEGHQLGVISTARHVHWEVSVGGRKVDPLAWLGGRIVTAPKPGQSGMLWLLLLVFLSSRR